MPQPGHSLESKYCSSSAGSAPLADERAADVVSLDLNKAFVIVLLEKLAAQGLEKENSLGEVHG